MDGMDSPTDRIIPPGENPAPAPRPRRSPLLHNLVVPAPYNQQGYGNDGIVFPGQLGQAGV